MAASKHDFTIEQGSSFKFAITYKDSNGDPINITDWCARLTWKTNKNIVQIFNSGNVDTSIYKFTIDGANGKLELLFPAATTNGFDFSTAKYDLELQSNNDHYTGGGKYTIRLLFGTISIQERYSKSDTALGCNT